MDLKTQYVSLIADIGNFDGTGYELTAYLRDRAISDLIRMCETQLVTESDNYADESITYYDTPFEEQYENQYEQRPEEEIAVDAITTTTTTTTNVYEHLDEELGIKISKFQSVISYYDLIIAANGVVADPVDATVNPVLDLINKFKELEGVYTVYGTFELSTSYTQA